MKFLFRLGDKLEGKGRGIFWFIIKLNLNEGYNLNIYEFKFWGIMNIEGKYFC